MTEHEFRNAFPALAKRIDATGVHKVEVTRSLASDDVTVIIKRTANSRGWGLAWFVDAGELRGMRGHVYRGDASDSAPGNVEFLREFDRRLAVIGAALQAVEGGGSYLDFCHDSAQRSPSLRSHRPPKPRPEVLAELRARAF